MKQYLIILTKFAQNSVKGWIINALISICVCMFDHYANSKLIDEMSKNYFSLVVT